MTSRGRRGTTVAVAAAVLLAAPVAARAQEVNLATLAEDDDAANRVHVRTGAEYGFVAGVGYARAVSVLERRILVSGDVTAPWAGFDASDYRVRAGVLVRSPARDAGRSRAPSRRRCAGRGTRSAA